MHKNYEKTCEQSDISMSCKNCLRVSRPPNFLCAHVGSSLESHQPSGLRWFSALYWSHPLPLFPRGGVYPSPYPLPRTQDPGSRAGLEILVATFLAISLLFFFASFFDAFLGRSWLRFPSQLASQNRPKSKKNRCQDAIHLGLRFLIDF